jgi:ligand-binding SRPBCC domain-containing protein
MPHDRLTKMVFRSRISATAEAVYRWYAEPDAFARLQPPWEKARVIERTGGIEEIGSSVTIRLYIGPFTKDWIAEHIACEPGRMFCDFQLSGPFRYWEHTHLFLQDLRHPESSWLEDRIEYQLPLGWFGKFLAGAWTRRKLKRLFSWRHRVTVHAFASSAKIGKDEGSDVPSQTN